MENKKPDNRFENENLSKVSGGGVHGFPPDGSERMRPVEPVDTSGMERCPLCGSQAYLKYKDEKGNRICGTCYYFGPPPKLDPSKLKPVNK